MSIHNLNFKYSTVKYKQRHRKYPHTSITYYKYYTCFWIPVRVYFKQLKQSIPPTQYKTTNLSKWPDIDSINYLQTYAHILWPFSKQVTWLVVTGLRSESFRLITERRHYNARPIYGSGSYVKPVLFFIVECGIARFLCAMRVFDVRPSSSLHRLPLCQISFLSTPITELARWKNCVLNLLTHIQAYLVPGNRSEFTWVSQ